VSVGPVFKRRKPPGYPALRAPGAPDSAADSSPGASTLEPGSEPVTVWVIDTPECPEYEAFVREHPRATVYHSLRWRDALTKAGAGRPCYLMAMRGNRAVGVWPLFQVIKAGTKRLVSMPAKRAASLLAVDKEARRALEDRAEQLLSNSTGRVREATSSIGRGQ